MAKNFNNKSRHHVETDFYNPYTFVDVPDDVLTLDTSEDNNEVDNLNYIHDVPFENGYSGKIEVDFQSMTKFCVLGASEHNTNINGRYYVPGSSIKGMLRAVFEMLTFSNIKNGIEDNRYSMRNLRSNDYELKAANSSQKSGFLINVNGKYYIQECENTRFRYEDPKREENTIKDIYPKLNIIDFQRANVAYKYKLIGSRFLYDNNGDDAVWFFSGPMQNKKHEFLFSVPKFSKTHAIEIKERIFEDFCFIHENENESESWKFWRGVICNYKSFEEVKKEGIAPCFFRKENGDVKDFGFAFLYRQPYSKTIHDCLPENLRKNNGIDITQAVFGFVKGKTALKGRVVVSNSMLDENIQPGKSQTFIMGAPKPTYFEFYLNQDQKKFDKSGRPITNTYFSKNARINGYKRYLVHNKEIAGMEKPSNVTSTFYPMPENTKFKTVISFHNLLDYELGALLSAITFCNNENTCFHSLGYAKPFGYGKIKVNGCKLTYLQANSEKNQGKSIDDFYKAFKQLMTDCDLKHQLEDVLADLIIAARGHYNPTKDIRYPKSGMEVHAKDKNNEFVAIQNDKNLSIKDFAPKK